MIARLQIGSGVTRHIGPMSSTAYLRLGEILFNVQHVGMKMLMSPSVNIVSICFEFVFLVCHGLISIVTPCFGL